MLPARHRMRRGEDFTRATRGGSRASGRYLVVHLVTSEGPPSPDVGHASDPDPTPADPARVGFVVSKGVGGAVVRNRVKRRLREAMRAHVGDLPDGALAVVRALPASRDARYPELQADLARSFEVATSRARRPRTPPRSER